MAGNSEIVMGEAIKVSRRLMSDRHGSSQLHQPADDTLPLLHRN